MQPRLWYMKLWLESLVTLVFTIHYYPRAKTKNGGVLVGGGELACGLEREDTFIETAADA